MERKPPFTYQLGLFLVTVGMIILPLIYLALTAWVCWEVYYFATHHFVAIWNWHLGYSKYSLLIKVLASCTPLLVGVAVAIAMVKPLFKRAGKRMQPMALDPAVEPKIHELARKISEMVGSPAPRRIEVNCDLNASAAFARGFSSFFSHDLILTLGLPMIAGLTERQLVGVIAHEFGHFRQAAGMRLTYIIRSVNFWFARVVYERDALDETLASGSDSESMWINVMFACARAGVGISRGVLWVLMMIGHGLSGLLLRQMEYDADRCEIAVAGSADFVSTTVQFAVLGEIFSDIHRGMRKTWRSNLQLPDNLPVLMEYRALKFPAEKVAKVEGPLLQTKTGWFDTHPSAADRIAQAHRLNAPGEWPSDGPARDLFENFETLGRFVTLAHYEDDLEVPTQPDFLIPLEKLVLAAGEEAKTAATTAAPAPQRTTPPVPMMAYNPSAFQSSGEAGSTGQAGTPGEGS